VQILAVLNVIEIFFLACEFKTDRFEFMNLRFILPSWYPEYFSWEVKRLERELDHTPPNSIEVKNAWNYVSFLLHILSNGTFSSTEIIFS
jgi:hypothetical protein